MARFAWEYKGKHKDLDAPHRQLLQYAGALENPPLLVTSEIERITIRTNWTDAVSERHEVRLEDVADPVRLGVLKSVFADPKRLRPERTWAALTAQAAAEFAELAGQLRTRGNDAGLSRPAAALHSGSRGDAADPNADCTLQHARHPTRSLAQWPAPRAG